MRHLLEDIAQFHKTFGHPVREAPIDPSSPDFDVAYWRMRLRLVAEEFFELLEASLGSESVRLAEAKDRVLSAIADEAISVDLVETADALADLGVVEVGFALSAGIPLDRVWAEVHQSNMAKVGPDGTVRRRPDGKILKPDGWQPPNIRCALTLKTQARWMTNEPTHYSFRAPQQPTLEVLCDGELVYVISPDAWTPAHSDVQPLPLEVEREAERRFSSAVTRWAHRLQGEPEGPAPSECAMVEVRRLIEEEGSTPTEAFNATLLQFLDKFPCLRSAR